MRNCIIFSFLFLYAFALDASVDDRYQKKNEILELEKEISLLKNDSLIVMKMLDLVVMYPDWEKERFELMQKGLEMARRLDMKPEMGTFYSDMAWYSFFDDNKEQAVKYFKESVKYCEDPLLTVYAYGCLSNIYSWEGGHDAALKYAEECLEAAEESKQLNLIADAYMFIGDVYRYKEEQDTAKIYYLKALKNLNVERDFFSILRLVANIYLGDSSLVTPFQYYSYSRMLKYHYETASPRLKQIFVFNITTVH